MRGQFFPYQDENVSKSFPYVTVSIIALNVAVFLWSLLDFENILNTYGFVPAGFSILTIFTAMFLHGGIDHIFGNMWYLWLYGDNVEDRMGKIKYLAFYLLSGVAATLVHYMTNVGSEIPAVGASGAISGVLGAYLVLFPNVRIKAIGPFYQTYRLPASMLIGLWFGLQFLFGLQSFAGGTKSGIAFWAHIGGFAFGYLAAKVMFGQEKKRQAIEET